MLWLRNRHPAEPPSWRADVKAAERRAARWAAGTLKLRPGEEVFDEALWTAHKVTFSRCQCGKCGYCEMSIAADPSGGDVEHYRPKGEVTALGDDATTWGREVEGHNSRDPKHRRQAPRVSAGYWWLAYWETIRTCCLDRETLVRSRLAVAEVAWPAVTRVLKELKRSPRREGDLRRALSGLLKLGGPRREHAGMVRAMWAQRDPYGLSWAQLRALREALRTSP